MTDLETFLETKRITAPLSGFDIDQSALNPAAFDWQKLITQWAIRRGKAAIFADYGLGKTLQILMYAQAIIERTNKPFLILSPLGAAKQTSHIESPKFGYDAIYCKSQDDVPGRAVICVTNYERLHLFDPRAFGGMAADEASIIKDFAGKIRNQIMGMFRYMPYKLLATATPSPNDHAELGNYCQALDIMSYQEMLSTFFERREKSSSAWSLGGWGAQKFWEWLASWAMVIRKPSDLGYSDDGYNLPPLHIHTIDVARNERRYIQAQGAQLYLFPVEARGMSDQRNARKVTMEDRVEAIAEMVSASNEQWVIWGETNAECDYAEKRLKDAVQVAGRHTEDHKEDSIIRFRRGSIRVLVSKTKIFGHGLNLQNCHMTAYLGWSNSFEQFDQSLHRFHRYGQPHAVHAHIASTDFDGAIVRNIERKRTEHEERINNVVQHMQAFTLVNVQGARREQIEYQPTMPMRIPAWL
jgi:hypothetical protein